MSIAVYSAQQTQQLFDLFSAMTDYYAGDPARINHFVKVHAYARQIGLAEQLDADTLFLLEADALFLLEAAALTHDIGIREAERLYGQCGGKLQERLGPPEAQKMLDSLGFAPDVTERVCFLIAHHHTLDGVDGLDWRILLEADFLVNMIEEGMKAEAIQCGREKIFRTRMGLRLMERLTEKKCNS